MKLAQIEAVTRGVTTALREHLSAELEKRDAEIAALRAALEARPEPKDGADGRDGKDGERGADGRGVAVAELKGGDLILRFTDGEEINVGRVTGEQGPQGEKGEPGEPGQAGKDGAAGLNGKDGEPGPRGPRGEKGIDGRDGRDGKDGIASRDEMNAEVDARVAAAVEAEVQRRVAEAVDALPVLQYRGVYRSGESYRAGDVVTWGGSAWHCREATTEKPDPSDAWQLMVKKGARGRDAS